MEMEEGRAVEGGRGRGKKEIYFTETKLHHPSKFGKLKI